MSRKLLAPLMVLTITSLFALLLTSCGGSLKPLEARQVRVEPQPLVLQGGKVPATITINFPAKWFHRKAELKVTPVLKYATGQVWGTTYSFQGEKVRGNATTVQYSTPQSVTLYSDFDYTPEMKNSELYLMFTAKIGNREQKLADLKVGEGVLATEALASAAYATPAIAPDAFQRIIKEQYDAHIHFLIQQANLRSSELNSADVKEWKGIVESAHITPNQKVDVEVQAYASPDGGRELNEKLAAQRERNTSNYIERELKRAKVDAPVAAHYTAQDWEGFKSLVEASNIQDKELVLRVLSMYNDPEIREREIKNISSVFSQLADEILPQLRRSRLVANIQIIGKSDAEIAQLAKDHPERLNVEELLYSATLYKEVAEKERIYLTASRLYPNDARSFNNLAKLAMEEGDLARAEQYLQKSASVAPLQEAKLNQGLIELSRGNLQQAQTLIGQAGDVPELNEALGLIYLRQGKYAEAAKALQGVATNNGVLAQILNNDLHQASQLLSKIEKPDATTYYLTAIIGARTNDTNMMAEGIKAAVSANPALKNEIATDREFARYAAQSLFQSALR